MALGLSRPRNGGVEFQLADLSLLLHRRNVNYRLVPHRRDRHQFDLWLYADNHKGLALPPVGCCATLVNVRPGRWEARDIFDGRVRATGHSRRSVIAAAIRVLWA